MQITIEWLKRHKTCLKAIDEFQEKWPKRIDGITAVRRLIAEDKLDWANWLIVQVMKREQSISYALYAAEQAIDIYERKYPDDKRPRQAIEATKKYLIHNMLKKGNAIYATIYPFAANAAYAIVYAAYATVYTAIYAANKEMQLKILNYGLRIIKGKEKK